MAKEGILLESGTNEMELLEFIVGSQGFGVNVAKIQAIEPYDRKRVTRIPNAHPSVAGMLLFREKTIPLIDLTTELDMVDKQTQKSDSQEGAEPPTRIVLAMEFNRMAAAFLVDGVNRIHRISWEQISPLSPLFVEHAADFTGSVQLEGRDILIVDVEKIVAEVLPAEHEAAKPGDENWSPYEYERAGIKIILAEDSGTIRNMLLDVLKNGNYTDVESFDNGGDALSAINERVAKAKQTNTPLPEHLNIVISDIEMPKMDGLALCKRIKQEMCITGLPIIMFSSLINEQMIEKCKSVGADAYISKPQFGELVNLLDKLCFTEGSAKSETEAIITV